MGLKKPVVEVTKRDPCRECVVAFLRRMFFSFHPSNYIQLRKWIYERHALFLFKAALKCNLSHILLRSMDFCNQCISHVNTAVGVSDLLIKSSYLKWYNSLLV